MLSKEELKLSIKNYFSNLILIWLAIILYRYNPYYLKFLNIQTQKIILFLALSYTLSLPFYLLFRPRGESKGFILIRTIKRVIKESFSYLKNLPHQNAQFTKLEKEEKTAILFIIVKLYFLPMIINFGVNNYFDVINNWAIISNYSISMDFFTNDIYQFSIPLLFLIDTAIFSFGYTFEAGFLKNKVRSVEPTFFGWAVALLCYPPFNTLTNNYLSWYPYDYAVFSSLKITFLLRILMLLLLVIYVWASIALGGKCSNLTNRGIVSKGPYRIIRHPAYICKNMIWWITIIPVINIYAFFSMLTWTFIYFLRAITEERHLILDQDYAEYCKKVKYRFIPSIY